MTKTFKKNSLGNNKTKKTKYNCPIALKPFEKDYSKNMSKKQFQKTIADTKKEFVKELLSTFAPSSIKPENDFYDYINYQWINKITLEKQQKYIVQIDPFRLAQDKVYNQLSDIILDYVKKNNNNLASNLKKFYNSVIKMNPLSYSRKLAQEAVQTVDKFISEKNPWNLLAFINSDEMISYKAPFSWTMQPDVRNPKLFCSYIGSYTFSILDSNVYFEDGTDVAYKNKYRNAFKKNCRDIFYKALGPNNYDTDVIFDIEQEIITKFLCPGVTETEEGYNKIYKDEALSKYGFDWHQFSKAMGYKKTPKFFICSSLGYLKCCSELLVKNWDTPKWRTFWIWILLTRIVRITPGWEDILYNFYGSFQQGQEAINRSDSVSAALYMSLPFNNFLSKEYVAKYENPQYMAYLKTLCDDLKIVFNRILEKNTWMSPSTKAYALKKMKAFKFIFGVPDKIPEDPTVNYGDLLYDNLKKLMDWRHKWFVRLDGKPSIDLPTMDWSSYPVKLTGSQPYIVNASYTPAKNAIYINLGFIQKPFIDLDDRGIEYNLARIGGTISHEMSHGFDQNGSKYGADGRLTDWWTDSDKKKYKQIQDDVIKQYEEFAARDGI
jgi:predicted metalloendopeptidase